jgi:hypothetical protein
MENFSPFTFGQMDFIYCKGLTSRRTSLLSQRRNLISENTGALEQAMKRSEWLQSLQYQEARYNNHLPANRKKNA